MKCRRADTGPPANATPCTVPDNASGVSGKTVAEPFRRIWHDAMRAPSPIFVHRLREHIPNLTLSPPAHYIRVCLTVSRIRSDRRRNPVIEMTASASFSYLTPQFDDFLFARIDEDGEATPLSVLSVLARLGVDPWEEAAKLAQLPRISAAERLAAFIAATPGRRRPI